MLKIPRSDPEYMRQYYVDNRHKWPKRSPEKQAAHNASRRHKYQTDAEYRQRKIAEVQADYRKHPHTSWARTLRKSGLTLDDYDRMLLAQGSGCAICGNPDPGDRRMTRFHVDHCHLSGVIRGLLCSSCNLGLGKFKDDPAHLSKAAAYVLKYKKDQPDARE